MNFTTINFLGFVSVGFLSKEKVHSHNCSSPENFIVCPQVIVGFQKNISHLTMKTPNAIEE